MKDIKDYEGLYAVTSCGKVWSYRRKIFLKPSKDKHGYLRVKLTKDGVKKNKRVHRLVMETYCPCENMNKLDVNHINEIKTDNFLNNLEWLNHKENCNYGTRNQRATITRGKRVRCIETDVIYNSIGEAAKAINRSISSLSNCLAGRTKTCGGYHWEFVD